MRRSNHSGGGASGGVGVTGLLLVLFVALKLTGVIDWSWWWVTAPSWGVFAIILAAALVYLLFAAARDLLR